MYCVKCGVELADTEKQCPLCATVVYHPELSQPEAVPLYPGERIPQQHVHPWGVLLVISVLFLLPLSICLVCDMQINGRIEWSGYVAGGLLLLYVIAVLPNWFPHPNPVIFVPVSFAAIAGFLLYVDLATDGGWFLSFALPVTGGFGIIVTAVVTLMRYIRKGKLYILGGTCLALGGFMLLLEYLLHITFDLPGNGTWSLYPLICFGLLGGTLLAVAICRPLRETLDRKLFF